MTFKLLIETLDEKHVGIVADTVILPHRVIGRNVQLPLGNLAVFIRIKNRFHQYTDFPLGMIEV